MQKYVMVLARGDNFLECKPGVFITCCTDGFRPVFYEPERMQSDETDNWQSLNLLPVAGANSWGIR